MRVHKRKKAAAVIDARPFFVPSVLAEKVTARPPPSYAETEQILFFSKTASICYNINKTNDSRTNDSRTNEQTINTMKKYRIINRRGHRPVYIKNESGEYVPTEFKSALQAYAWISKRIADNERSRANGEFAMRADLMRVNYYVEEIVEPNE